MTLAFLDLATRKTGWCVGRGDALPAAGAWLWPSADLGGGSWDFGLLLDHLDQDLNRLIEAHSPDRIGYEAPILVSGGAKRKPGQYGDSLENLRKIYPLGAHVEWVCRKRGIACCEVDLRAIKRELAGFSTADKDAMVAAAEKIGLRLPETKNAGREDAADAFGGWLVLIRLYAKTYGPEWDRRLWGQRSTLL